MPESAFRRAKTASAEPEALQAYLIPRHGVDQTFRVVLMSGLPPAHEGNALWHVWDVGTFDQGITRGLVEAPISSMISIGGIPIDDRDWVAASPTLATMASLVKDYKAWLDEIGKDLPQVEQDRYCASCARTYSEMRDRFYLRDAD